MEKGLISVIIPVYNCEPYLRTCVKSVTDSDFENLQIILVDDGCTDGSSSLCDELARADKRIEVIHKENGGPGPSSARNAGLDAVKGEYITFVDSDDVIMPDMISGMYDIAVNDNCDIVKFGMLITTDEHTVGAKVSEYCVMDKKEALRRVSESDISWVTVCSTLYLASLFDGLRFPLGMFYEDEYLSPKLLYRSERVAICATQGYLYIQRTNDSVMRGKFSPAKLLMIDMYEERINWFKQWGYDDLLPCAYQKYFWSLRHCYKKTLTDEYRKEHKAVVKRFKELKLKNLHMSDKFLCVCGRIGCLKFGEKIINLKEKIKYYFKRIFVRLKKE